MTDAHSRRSLTDAVFERKIRLSRLALFFERLWPRVWALLTLVGLFLIVSLLGVWQGLSEVSHKILLSAFGIAALGVLFWMVRTPGASREDAIRRIERRSGVPHRPASAYEDTLTASSDDPAAATLWRAHRARLEALLGRLRVGSPQPRADRYDPFALRAVLVMGIALLMLAVGDSASDRLGAAFRFGNTILGPETRLDAWVTPPAYTGRPPIILADGSHAVGAPGQAKAEAIVHEVPERSVLIVRATGQGARGLTLEVTQHGKASELIEAKPQAAPATSSGTPAAVQPLPSDVAEIKLELKTSSTIRVVGASAYAPWQFRVTPDQPPKISLTKEPERMPRGSLKLSFKVEDDYGVVAAEGRITRAPPKPGDPAKSWAKREANKGPRPPLERPPVLALRLPRVNAKQAEGASYHELGGHPWAGVRVRLQLFAKDQAGQTGKSEPIEFILPQRRFTNLIAKAVVEQRRLLVEDPRNRPHVIRGLDAISLEPEGFFTDQRAYLGLRSAFWRLQHDKTRAGMRSIVDQLWHVALRLEDGNLSEAERALREAQERLAKALQDGASDEEIRQLMNELRQALNQFMEQLARQSEGQQMPQGFSENQTIRSQDLERMMRDIENMARQGSRDMAQQMLSQLRDLLEQLQSGRMAQGQNQQGREMMQMMDQFGDIIGKQQQLLDDTFGEQQRQDGQDGQEGQQGKQGRQGQQGQGRQGQQQGRRGQRGQGQQGQGQGDLGQRQGDLRDRLGRLREGMQRFGMRGPPQLDGAERSMQEAEQALRNGDLDGAARAEQRALEQLRQGAQSMAEQMLRQMPSRFGRSGDAPRDPLGRPPRTDGPDFGTSVKVPDEIDVQRAREILEELRRRLGEPSRPLPELDYIDRLLRRF